MTLLSGLLVLVAVATAVYLLVTLLFPERF